MDGFNEVMVFRRVDVFVELMFFDEVMVFYERTRRVDGLTS